LGYDLKLHSLPTILTQVYDEDLGERAPTDQAQPLRRKNRSMIQDLESGQDSPAMTSTPTIPQRITKSRA